MMKSIPWDGGKITRPGMYSGVPMKFYHGDCCDGPSVSTSGLKKIWRSPAHYFSSSYLNPNRDDDPEESSALIFGRAIHHLILGEANFASFFAEEPQTYEDEKTGEDKKWHNGANACKRWNAERAKEGKYVLTKKEIESARGIANSLAANDLVDAADLLTGIVERSLFWKDEKTGIWLKQRPDVIPTFSADTVDLKTTENVDFDKLRKSLFEYGYFQQGAMARDGFRTVLEMDVSGFTFTLFYVEKKDPWCPRPVIVKDIDLAIGDVVNRACLDIMETCLKTGVWWGPRSLTGEVIEHIEMTAWQKNSICRKLDLMGYPTPEYEGKNLNG